MFSKDNIINVKDLYDLAAEICPDEIQINTPLRPCSVKPLSKTDIDSIKEHFKDMNSVSVYDALTKKVKPISSEDTLKRRGKI
jgi:wyosine [tRNA(Phe)-imidazoG37] synthetase (radical SAM superfamily)